MRETARLVVHIWCGNLRDKSRERLGYNQPLALSRSFTHIPPNEMDVHMSSSDSDVEVLVLFALARRRKKRRKRRISVHEINQRREKFREYHHLVQELYFHPDKFHQYFRMSEEQFDFLRQSPI